jgi:DNA-binding response OmpR family regulator
MGMKILVIEDDSMVALHTKQAISFLGHQVVECVKNGEDALRAAEEHEIDLVVSDIQIEGEMDGLACSKILQDRYGVPVILISAHNDIPTLQRATDIELAGYLIKPFREDELKTLLDLVELKVKSNRHEKRKIINKDYNYCPQHKTLYNNDTAVELTIKELSFLETLIDAKGAIVSYEHVEYNVWNGEYTSDEARRQLVYRFRQKLPAFPLKLIKGVGYKLESTIS